MNECSSEAVEREWMREVNQEIRPPLSAIAGIALSLAHRLEEDDAAAAYLIANSCERLVHKIDRYFSDLAHREQPEGPKRVIKPNATTAVVTYHRPSGNPA